MATGPPCLCDQEIFTYAEVLPGNELPEIRFCRVLPRRCPTFLETLRVVDSLEKSTETRSESVSGWWWYKWPGGKESSLNALFVSLSPANLSSWRPWWGIPQITRKSLWKIDKEGSTHHCPNCCQKIFSKMSFRSNYFCNYYKNTLHLARKRSHKYYKTFLSGKKPVAISHGVLQGAAQRGAQFYLIFAALQTFLSCSKISLFYLKTCTPMKGTPLSALKSQQFLRFAIAMPIANPRNRTISETRESNAALRFKSAMESR